MNYITLPRGLGRYKRSFRSGFYKDRYESRRNAKERKRLNPEPVQDEPKWTAPKLPRLPFATISIQIGRERRTLRVTRYGPKRLIALGKVQAASSIGRRIALLLEAML